MSVGKAIVWGILALALTVESIKNFSTFSGLDLVVLIVLAIGSWGQTIIEAKE